MLARRMQGFGIVTVSHITGDVKSQLVGKLMFEEGLDLFSVFDRVPRRGLLATEHYSTMRFRPTSTLGLLQW